MPVQTQLRPGIASLALLAGLGSGTVVLTLRGEVAVEDLVPGDKVVTRDTGAVPLRGVERFAARVAPVRVAAGSLGHTRPERDMLMGPGTRVHLRDWRARALYGRARALVEAHRLVDGEFVTEERPRGMTLHALLFDAPQVIYADGLEVGA